jgi:putative DNA primase/helicase
MFTDIGGGRHLGGIDLDSCRNPQSGATEPWAQAIIERFGTYAEVSPSATGHKLFFIYEPQPEIDKIFGGKGGRVFKNGNGQEHPPAIEAYVRDRFFAVTGDASSPHDVVLITPDDLRWLIGEAGPNFVGKSTDQSRSAKAFRKDMVLKAQGASYEQMRDALLNDDDSEIAAWARGKGLADDERELRRIWDNAPKFDEAPSHSEEALALAFTAKHQETLRYLAVQSRWLLWHGERWCFESTLKAFDFARAVCRQRNDTDHKIRAHGCSRKDGCRR